MFGQLAGRSVFNTPTCFTHFRPIFGLLFEKSSVCLRATPSLHPHFVWPRKPRCWPHAFWQSCARGRLGVLSKDADPISPTTKLLAGMLASEAAAERVFTEH